MSEAAKIRKERIERLLSELQYELVRGLTDGEIDEEMHWRYVLPMSKAIPGGVVTMAFVMRPAPTYAVPTSWGFEPNVRLRLVGEDDHP